MSFTAYLDVEIKQYLVDRAIMKTPRHDLVICITGPLPGQSTRHATGSLNVGY